MSKIAFSFCLIYLVSCVFGRPQIYSGNTAAIPYDFNYKVENPATNTFFGQNEAGDQSGRKAGSYYVYLPDGKLMTVDYVADVQGYIPKITYQTGARSVQG